MLSLTLYSLIFAIAFQIVHGSPVKPLDSDVPKPHALFNLGSVNGKTYYSEAGVNRNWMETKTFCESNNMTMATVRNKAEADFLESITDQTNFYGGFWLGGRDARSIRQFSWDLSGDAVEDNLVRYFDNYYPTGTCLYYEGVYHNYYEGRPCTFQYAQALCESYEKH